MEGFWDKTTKTKTSSSSSTTTETTTTTTKNTTTTTTTTASIITTTFLDCDSSEINQVFKYFCLFVCFSQFVMPNSVVVWQHAYGWAAPGPKGVPRIHIIFFPFAFNSG